MVGGGAEKFLAMLCKQLVSMGHSAEILTFSSESDDYSLNDNIVRHNLQLGSGSNESKSRVLQDWLNQQEQQNCVYDVIVSNLRSSDELWALIKHPNIYFCLHNHTSTRELLEKSFWKRKKILHGIKQLYSGKKIIAVSQGVADDFEQNLKVPIVSMSVIPNGFDFAEIIELSKQAFEPPCERYILHVGSFKAQKRHDRLLEAYAKSDIGVPLVLLGKGSVSRTKKIKKWMSKYKLEDKVHLVGFFENPYSWIAQADMLVLSSDCEGFGRVLVEALVLGTSVVSTNCPAGPSDILVGDLSQGLAQLSVKDLAKKMEFVYEKPISCSPDLGSWSIESVAKQYIDLVL